MDLGEATQSPKKIVSDSEDAIGRGSFTLFQVMTLEGWGSVARLAMSVEPWVWRRGRRDKSGRQGEERCGVGRGGWGGFLCFGWGGWLGETFGVFDVFLVVHECGFVCVPQHIK